MEIQDLYILGAFDLNSALYSIVIGAIAGFLAGLVMKRGFSLIVKIIVGIIGGFIGSYVFGLLGVPQIVSPIVHSIIAGFSGAVILIFILGLIKK